MLILLLIYDQIKNNASLVITKYFRTRVNATHSLSKQSAESSWPFLLPLLICLTVTVKMRLQKM